VTDPFADRRREAFQDDYLPAWTVDAACRGDKRPDVTSSFTGSVGQLPTGVAWEDAFLDDVVPQPDGSFTWSKAVLDVMAQCASCPVRAECLAYGFAGEKPILLGTRLADDEEAERIGRSYVQEWLFPLPSGIYGGVPGRVRKQLRHGPDCPDRDECNGCVPIALRVSAASAWFDAERARNGWTPADPDTMTA
jgi:hypothetical protein